MGAIQNNEKSVKISITYDDLQRAIDDDESACKLMLATLGTYFLKTKAPALFETVDRSIVSSQKLSNVGLEYALAKKGYTKAEAFSE